MAINPLSFVPVVWITLALAAQDIVTLHGPVPAKIPFLMAVACYALLGRPLRTALGVGLAAGLLADALGGLPLLCTAGFIGILFLLLRVIERVFTGSGWLYGVAVMTVAGPLEVVWTRLFAGWTGVPFFSATTAWQVLLALPAGMLAGALGFGFCGWLDRWLGYKQEPHGLEDN